MQVSRQHAAKTSSRGKVVAAAVDKLIDVDVVNDVVRIVVGRQVSQHQVILVKVVHHCASHHNASTKQLTSGNHCKNATAISKHNVVGSEPERIILQTCQK